MAVSQSPVLLWGVKEQTQDVETKTIFLVASPFVRADQDAAFELRVRQHHNLSNKKYKFNQEIFQGYLQPTT